MGDFEENVKNLNLNDTKILETIDYQIKELQEKLQSEIDLIENDVERIKEMPIGSIVSWVLKPQNEAGHVQVLPEGWIRCDGSIIPEPSVWAGSHTPDLNGERLF